DTDYTIVASSLKLDPATSMLPVVRGMSEPSGLERPDAVVIVPDATFDSVDAAVELVRDEVERWREEKHLFGRLVTLRSPSDERSVEKLKSILEKFYADALSRDATEDYKTLSAFREAIDNAAHHGNRGRRDRHLTVNLMQNDDRLAIDVKDEGPGFDHERLLLATTSGTAAGVARERLGEGLAGGLGLRLMAECVDEVRYAEDGSRVTLVKRRRASG
ncbi:unnamed protein product, partial [marine sediment metagenome]